MMINTYPLSWPAGWARTNGKDRIPSRFGRGEDLDVHAEQEKLSHQLALLKAKEVKLSSDLALKANGTPKVHQSALKDPGVAVYFELKNDDIVLACDRWPTVEENIAALRSHINALRGMDRWALERWSRHSEATSLYLLLPQKIGKVYSVIQERSQRRRPPTVPRCEQPIQTMAAQAQLLPL